MSTGVTCTVLVEGVRAADGSPGDDLLGPVVLDDLAITWGRSDTMSQPEPDSCSFDVMDQLGGQAFMATFATGLRVDVLAHGETFPDPSVPTFVNPGFELPTVTWSATGGAAARTTTRFQSGTTALALTPAVAGQASTVLLAPGELQPAGTNPDAWDAIPTTSVGQTWQASVSVWLPPGSSVTVRAALFSGPYASAAAPGGVQQTIDGDGTWQTISASQLVQRDDVWVGLQLVFNPTGQAWDELPPTLTWDGVDPTWSWDDTGTLYVDSAQVTSPAGGTGRGVLVFSGRITEMQASWDTTTSSPVVRVVATGFTADLQNRNVGDEPWDVETVDARAHRILELAGLPIDIDIDTSIDEVLLSYRDVDSQGATGLLTQIATSVDGVLWPAVHQSLGAYLRLEDPSLRASLLKLTGEPLGPPTVTVRTNLATNPSAETQQGPWTGTALGSFGRNSGWAHEGAWSLRAQTPGTGSSAITGDIRQGSATTFPPGIVPGGTYTISAWQNTPAAHAAFSTAATSRQRRVMVFYSLNGSTFTQLMGPQGANIAGTQRLSGTFTISPNATGAIVAIGCAGSGSDQGFVSFVDDILIEAGSTLGDSFTGATPDTATTDYAWTGTPEISTSTATTTIVQPDQIVIVQTDPDIGFDLSACVVLRDPVSWVQDVSDVVTRVAVGWLVQGVDDDGLPTTSESTELVVDPDLEQRYGTRRVAVSTQLQAATDAQDVAQRILARTAPGDWRVDGLTIDDEDVTGGAVGVALVLDLLDGTSRIGAPIVLGDLPVWSPGGAAVGVYLEGGTYRFVGGRWVLELGASSAGGLGMSAAWDELDPAWQWDQWDPAITWNDLRGVAAP